MARTIVPEPASSTDCRPWATIRPLPMITRWSATASISFSRCEESRTVPPRSAKSRSRPRIQRMPSGSSPLAGSSRISTSGSPSIACASPSRWRMPSEYWRTRLRAAERSRPTSVSNSSTRDGVDAHHLRRDGERLAPAAAAVLGARVEQHADAVARVGKFAVAAAEHGRVAGVGLREPDQHPQRRGLAGAVRSEEPGHGAGLAAEGDVADHSAPAKLFREPCCFDHGSSIGRGGARHHGRRSMPGSTSVGGRAAPAGVRCGHDEPALADVARRPARGAGSEALRARLDRRRDDVRARGGASA